MIKDYSISVAMTTYNGEKYVNEQISSILSQLNICDELIISDDGSTDGTIRILQDLQIEDSRIKVYLNNGLGVVKNFEFAVTKCSNDIICLSDQDDIWFENKVQIIKAAFAKSNKEVLLHNAYILGDFSCDKHLIKNMKNGFVSNLLFSSYWGCCMAFKKEFRTAFLPFPSSLSAHDQWIGLISEFKKMSIYLDEPLIYHRVHKGNVTKKLNSLGKVKFRIQMLMTFFEAKIINLKNIH